MVSYTTVSPLPALRPVQAHAAGRRSVLCGTVLRVTPSGRYPPPCPAEPGRSSSHLRDARPPGQPIRCPFYGLRPAAARTAGPRIPVLFARPGGTIRSITGPPHRRLSGKQILAIGEIRWTSPSSSLLVVVLVLMLARMSIRIVRQYEQGVLFRLGRVVGVRMPGLRFIIPVIDRLPARQPADRDNADPVAGHHHPGQCQRRHLRGGVLPGDRCREVRRGD